MYFVFMFGIHPSCAAGELMSNQESAVYLFVAVRSIAFSANLPVSKVICSTFLCRRVLSVAVSTCTVGFLFFICLYISCCAVIALFTLVPRLSRVLCPMMYIEFPPAACFASKRSLQTNDKDISSLSSSSCRSQVIFFDDLERL